MTQGSQFKASLRLLSTEEGGREQPVALVIGYAATHWYRPQFVPIAEKALHYACSVEHPAPETVEWFELHPGEQADVHIKTFATLPVEIGWKFRLYEGDKLVGSGVVTQIIEG